MRTASSASSAARWHSTSTSSRARSKASSMRCGWIRPSSISISRVILPISRRTGSKQDSSTASGVSSMITLTPVTVSKARMLRPSRPMIRPLTSSAGRCTTATTVCAVWSDATRWIASATIALARCLAECLRLGLDPPDHHGGVPADRFLLAGEQLRAGGLGGQPGNPDQLRLLGGRGRSNLLLPVVQLLRPRRQLGCRRLQRSARACNDFLVASNSPCSAPIRRRSATSACCSSASAWVAARSLLLGLLQFAAVLGERGGGLDGDPVTFGRPARPAAPRPGRGRRDGALRLGAGVRPQLLGVLGGSGWSVRRRPRTAVRRTASAASAAAVASWLSSAKCDRSGSCSARSSAVRMRAGRPTGVLRRAGAGLPRRTAQRAATGAGARRSDSATTATSKAPTKTMTRASDIEPPSSVPRGDGSRKGRPSRVDGRRGRGRAIAKPSGPSRDRIDAEVGAERRTSRRGRVRCGKHHRYRPRSPAVRVS